MRHTLFLCFSILLLSTGISAQTRYVGGTSYDTIYATIEHNGIQMRLVTTIYKDTLRYAEGLKVPTHPVVRNQKIEVYHNGILKRWHTIKLPHKYAYTQQEKLIKYQSIIVLGLSVQRDGEKFFFMADGCEYGCGIVEEFLGIYSMMGVTMYEGHGLGGSPINSHWREKYGYEKPTTEIDYAFSRKQTLKDVSISNFFKSKNNY